MNGPGRGHVKDSTALPWEKNCHNVRYHDHTTKTTGSLLSVKQTASLHVSVTTGNTEGLPRLFLCVLCVLCARRAATPTEKHMATLMKSGESTALKDKRQQGLMPASQRVRHHAQAQRLTPTRQSVSRASQS